MSLFVVCRDKLWSSKLLQQEHEGREVLQLWSLGTWQSCGLYSCVRTHTHTHTDET